MQFVSSAGGSAQRRRHACRVTICSAPSIVTVDGVIGGKEKPKFDKKKFKATRSGQTTTIDPDNPAGLPPKANQAVIDYDKKDVKFDPDAVPGCKPSQIAGTTTEAALRGLRRRQGRDGTRGRQPALRRRRHSAGLPCRGHGVQQRRPEGILLHSRPRPLNTTTLLVGDAHGHDPDRDVPPLAGGAGSIAEFSTTVQAKDTSRPGARDKTIDYDGRPSPSRDTQAGRTSAASEPDLGSLQQERAAFGPPFLWLPAYIGGARMRCRDGSRLVVAAALLVAVAGCGEERVSYSDKEIIDKLNLEESGERLLDRRRHVLRGRDEAAQRLRRGRGGRRQGRARARDRQPRGQRRGQGRAGVLARLQATRRRRSSTSSTRRRRSEA